MIALRRSARVHAWRWTHTSSSITKTGKRTSATVDSGLRRFNITFFQSSVPTCLRQMAADARAIAQAFAGKGENKTTRKARRSLTQREIPTNTLTLPGMTISSCFAARELQARARRDGLEIVARP